MGTKVGLTGITFGDATVQNTAAVTGVTSLTAGSGISVSAATGAVTVSASGGGTVTSVATGNGLSGGTITSSGTLVLAAPTNNSVGAYQIAQLQRSGSTGFSVSGGDSYAASSSATGSITCSSYSGVNNMTGTWRVMTGNSVSSRYDACSNTQYNGNILMVRVS